MNDAHKPLAGKTALVTGASRGIGAAIALQFAQAGAHICVNYLDRDSEAAGVVKEIERLGGSAESVRADVSDQVAVRAMTAYILGARPAIDVLVNNAGILRDRSFAKMAAEEWNDVIRTNLIGTINVTSSVWPLMLQHKSGVVINIASFVGQAGNFGQANYAASKAGIIGLTKALALEGARHNVTVNAICPGFVETAMWRAISAEKQQAILAKIPLGRLAHPQEIAAAALFLASAARYITGQAINVNGGIYM